MVIGRKRPKPLKESGVVSLPPLDLALLRIASSLPGEKKERIRYAWLPLILSDGRYVWLENAIEYLEVIRYRGGNGDEFYAWELKKRKRAADAVAAQLQE